MTAPQIDAIKARVGELHPDCIGFEVLSSTGAHYCSHRFYDQTQWRDLAYRCACRDAERASGTIRQLLRGPEIAAMQVDMSRQYDTATPARPTPEVRAS